MGSSSRFGKGSNLTGPFFRECAATLWDAKLADIAEIKDPTERKQALFEYLTDWEPPKGTGGPPYSDHLIHVDTSDGRLEIPLSPLADEPLKRSMHRGLPKLIEELATAAGNRFPRLAEKARRLLEQVDVPFEELDAPMVQIRLDAVKSAQVAGAEDGDRFSDEVAAALDAVMVAGPALTMDDDLVDEMLARARRYRDDPDPEADRAAQDEMSRRVAADRNAAGPRLRALEAEVAGNPEASAAVVQKAVNRNVLWRIAVGLGSDARTIAGATTAAIIATQFGPSIVEFVAVNWSEVYAAAQTYGPFFADWFVASVTKVQEIAAVAASIPPVRKK
jgi:hypothetical protein